MTPVIRLKPVIFLFRCLQSAIYLKILVIKKIHYFPFIINMYYRYSNVDPLLSLYAM